MQIICPECGFTRDVPEDKLPERAQLATCPKCATKFKFRDLSDEFAVSEEPPATPPARPEPQQPTSEATEKNLWDQLENQTPESMHPESEAPAQAEPEEPAAKPVKRMYLDTTKAEPTAEPVSSPEPPPVPSPVPSPAPASVQNEQPDTEAEQTGEAESQGPKPVKRMYLDTTKPGAQAEPLGEEEETHSAAEQYLGQKTGETGGDEPEVDVPFERLDAFGFFPGLFETIKRSLTAPGLFFRTMKISEGLGKPVVFYVLIAEFYALMQLAWSFLGIRSLMDILYSTEPVPAEALGMGFESFIGLLALPLYFVVTLFLMSGITHFFLSMVRAGNRGFGATFRAVTYASAPLILTIVPLYGEAVGAVWNCVLTIIALKNVHRTSYGKIILSYVIMILSFTLFAVLLSFIAGGIAPKI